MPLILQAEKCTRYKMEYRKQSPECKECELYIFVHKNIFRPPAECGRRLTPTKSVRWPGLRDVVLSTNEEPSCYSDKRTFYHIRPTKVKIFILAITTQPLRWFHFQIRKIELCTAMVIFLRNIQIFQPVGGPHNINTVMSHFDSTFRISHSIPICLHTG